MGIEGVYGPKKLRRLERKLGLDIFRAAAMTANAVDISLKDVHKHLSYNPRTGETVEVPCEGFSSCARWNDRPERCTAETWHDDQKRIVRCELDAGHDGHHSRMTELWGIVWPEERNF